MSGTVDPTPFCLVIGFEDRTEVMMPPLFAGAVAAALQAVDIDYALALEAVGDCAVTVGLTVAPSIGHLPRDAFNTFQVLEDAGFSAFGYQAVPVNAALTHPHEVVYRRAGAVAYPVRSEIARRTLMLFALGEGRTWIFGLPGSLARVKTLAALDDVPLTVISDKRYIDALAVDRHHPRWAALLDSLLRNFQVETFMRREEDVDQ